MTEAGTELQERLRWKRRVVAAAVIMVAIMVVTIGVLATGELQSKLPEAIEAVSGVVVLNGPWKFKVGDDPGWAAAAFDDSDWERVDLTAPAGARDGDVGISGYVSGWTARGHAGYVGYAWYRMSVGGECERVRCAAMAGPAAVDSAYEVWVDGAPVGGVGQFGGATPRVFAIRPRMFAVRSTGAEDGKSNENRPVTIAVRVWMAPWDLAEDSGGMRVAPAIGTASAMTRLYRAQWMQTIRGYVVEIAEALIFFVLAGLLWTVRESDGALARCGWMCVAMVLTGLYRANQAVFFWSGAETVQEFEALSLLALLPACLAAWTMAWKEWFAVLAGPCIGWVVGVLTLSYVVGQFLSASWFIGRFEAGVYEAAGRAIRLGRLGLLALTVVVFVAAILRRTVRWKWISIVAMVLISVGQFAGEISTVGVPGIWFPFGVGVSRTQFVYVGFFVAVVVWMRRAVGGARKQKMAVGAGIGGGYSAPF